MPARRGSTGAERGRAASAAPAAPSADAAPPDSDAVPAAARDAPAVELGILDDFVGHLLRLAYEEAFADFARRLGPDTLKPGYFSMLSLISANPGINQAELGRASGRDKSSVAKALRQMEDCGLIRRLRLEDDRRSYASFLTEAGAEVHARMVARAREHMARLDGIIGPERREIFCQTLRDLVVELSTEPRRQPR